MRRSLRICAAAACCVALAAGCADKKADREKADREGGAPGDAIRATPSPGPAPIQGTAVLATVPDEGKPPAQPLPSGLGIHPSTPGGTYEFIFGERGGGVAYGVERGEKLQVVHNGRAGKAYEAVRAISLSPDGRRCAYGGLEGGEWRVVVDGVEGEPFGAVGRPVFSSDGAHVAYQAMRGERWYLVVDGKPNGGTRTRFILTPEFGGDSSRIAFVDDVVEETGAGRLVVSDLAFRKQTVVDGSVTAMLLSADRSRLAAISVDGGEQRVVTAAFDRPDRVEKGPPFEAVEALAFGADGASVAYVGVRAGERVVVLDGREEKLPEGHPVGPTAVRRDRRGVGLLVALDGGVALRQLFTDAGRREGAYEEAEGLVYGEGGAHAYAARRGEAWFVVVNGKEGPPFDRVVTPAFSPDGKLIVYRARKDGRRFVVVADTSGKTLRQHPAYEQVFPVVFTADGKSAAYGVKDGPRLAWRVEAL